MPSVRSIENTNYIQGWIQDLPATIKWAAIGLMGAMVGAAMGIFGLKAGLLILGVIITIPVVLSCLNFPLVGMTLLIIVSFFVEFARKFTALPAGVAMDGLILLLFTGLVIRLAIHRDFKQFHNPVSFLILIWVGYNFIQVLNPLAGSRMAWVFTVRSMAVLILLYFIACQAFSKKKYIFWCIYLIVALSIVSALYALKQELLGFSQGELNWLYADPERFQLIVQWSRFRVFSFASNPTNFGMHMALMAVFCFILAMGPYRWFWRLVFLGAGGLMVLGMAFAGSRTPFVMLPVGLIFFALVTYNKKVWITLLFLALVGFVFVNKSTSNAVIFRIQSAFIFKNSKDTLNVRLKNQKFIQPFIQRTPFGAGLGSTGLWGRRFTPDSWLSDFAHDSGYVRIAVELGWVGLLIYLALLFSIVWIAIRAYFRMIDPQIKNMYLALTTGMIMLIVANYPQEAIVQLPISISFYIFVSAIVSLKKFDTAPSTNHTRALVSTAPKNNYPRTLTENQ